MARRKKKTSDETSGVKRLRGKEMDSYLKLHPIVLYRYKANRPGFIFLLVLALFAVVVGLIVWKGVGLNSIFHVLSVGVLMTVALSLTGLVAYWTYYTRIHYVASSDQHLLLGRGTDVVAIDWEALDLNVLDFNATDDEQFQGLLTLYLDEERFRLRLFNGFIVLHNLPTLMLSLLTHVQDEEEQDNDELERNDGSPNHVEDDQVEDDQVEDDDTPAT